MAAIGGEAREIMFPGKQRSAVLENVHVDLPDKMPRAPRFKRRKDHVVPDAVRVDFPARGEARVEGGVRAGAAEDADFFREPRVERVAPFPGGKAASLHIRMGALAQRVDARIRAARAVDGGAPAQDRGEGSLQDVLHGVAALLALPAEV